MKRLFLALFVLSTISLSAQESVLLRANYKKGDKYVVTIEQIQNMGLQGGVNMNMTMDMSISEAYKDSIVSITKITSVKMDMMQGGMTMSYDSTKDDAELDEMGKAMKAQVEPMMKSVLITTMDRFGKALSIKTEPANPAMDQFSNQRSSVVFPEEKISVGSTWSSEDENMGMKMKMIFTVAKIENGTVYIDISGDVSGMGEGIIKGKTEIDIRTGIQKLMENEVTVKAMGQEVTVSSKVYMKKA